MPEIRAACEAAGKEAVVMLDTNCPWPVQEALRHDCELVDLGLHWLEEPVWPPENYTGLAIVRRTGRHRIAAGENAGPASPAPTCSTRPCLLHKALKSRPCSSRGPVLMCRGF